MSSESFKEDVACALAERDRVRLELAEQCVRYRRTLEYIASRESGVWGVIAKAGLDGEEPPTDHRAA